jgi:hypothetical protein
MIRESNRLTSGWKDFSPIKSARSRRFERKGSLEIRSSFHLEARDAEPRYNCRGGGDEEGAGKRYPEPGRSHLPPPASRGRGESIGNSEKLRAGAKSGRRRLSFASLSPSLRFPLPLENRMPSPPPTDSRGLICERNKSCARPWHRLRSRWYCSEQC